MYVMLSDNRLHPIVEIGVNQPTACGLIVFKCLIIYDQPPSEMALCSQCMDKVNPERHKKTTQRSVVCLMKAGGGVSRSHKALKPVVGQRDIDGAVWDGVAWIEQTGE